MKTKEQLTEERDQALLDADIALNIPTLPPKNDKSNDGNYKQEQEQ